MNQKNKYEIIITEKLQQLAVPDMEDAIWARIEARLDIELPPDDGPSSGPNSSVPVTGPLIGAGLLILLTALIYTLFPAKENAGDQEIIPGKTNTLPAGAPVTNQGRNDSLLGLPEIIPAPLQGTGQNGINDLTAIDTLTSSPGPDSLNLFSAVDSTAANRTSQDNTVTGIPPPAKNAKDSTSKKSRGVTGINDADYRIVPAKQDTGKQKNQ